MFASGISHVLLGDHNFVVGYIRIKERYYEFGGMIDFGRSPCSFEVAMEEAVSMAEKR